jgi:hypothetical protein
MSDKAYIYTKTKIFGTDVYKTEVEAGRKLSDILEGVDLSKYRLILRDSVINDLDYALKKGDVVNIIKKPLGGSSSGNNSGKQMMQIVASIAVLALSIATAGTLAPVLGLTGLGVSALQAGLGLAGMYLLSMLFPPQLEELDSSTGDKTIPSLSGQSNQVTLYKPIPKIYGTYRYNPPIAGRPFITWETTADIFSGKFTIVLKNHAQYLTCLLCIGYKPLSIGGFVFGDTRFPGNYKKLEIAIDDDGIPNARAISYDLLEHDLTDTFDFDSIRIGQTSIADYRSVIIEIGSMSDITIYKNTVRQENFALKYEAYANCDNSNKRPDGESAFETLEGRTMRLFSTVLSWDNSNVETDLDWPGGGSVPAEIYQVRTTQENVSNLNIELSFVQGLYEMSPEGNKNSAGTQVAIFYAPVGTALSSQGSWTDAGRYKITAYTSDPFQHTITINFPSSGQYEVLVYRVGTYLAYGRECGHKIYADFTLAFFRSYDMKTPPVNTEEPLLLAYQVLATDQLNGTIDNMSVEATSFIRKIHPNLTFEYVKTSNPAWIYLDALTCSANKTPIDDNRIDLATLQEWGEWCEENEVEYNWVELNKETLLTRLRAVASTGFASWNIIENKFTIVRDKANQDPVQMITPRNSWNFSSSKSFAPVPHAYLAKFIDRETWEESSITGYMTGYDETGSGGNIKATDIQELSTRGVTKHSQAYREAMYHLAVLRLRPEIFTLDMDVENLIATRGDLVLLSYDSLLVGMKWGRIKNVNVQASVVTLTVDEEFNNDGTQSYGVTIRTQNNEILNAPVTISSGIGITEFDIDLDDIDESKLNAGDLIVFGVLGTETIRVKVTNIEYNSDLSASLTLVDEAPAVLNAHTEPIPAYDPGITEPIDWKKVRPSTPIINAVNSDSSTLIRDIDGSFQPSITVSYSLQSSNVPIGSVELRYKETDADSSTYKYLTTSSDASSIRITNVEKGQNISLQIRAISSFNAASDWSLLKSVTVIGKDFPPSDVEGFNVFLEGNTVKATWEKIPDADRDEYEIRYTNSVSPCSWDEMSFLWKGKIVIADLGQFLSGEYTFAIKAIDTSDIYSENCVSFQLEIINPIISNLVYEIQKANIKFTWNNSNTSFKIDRYDVYENDINDFNTATLVGSSETNSFITPIVYVGTKFWFIQPIDDFGNVGDIAVIPITISVPSVLNISSTILDNNVLLQWSSVQGTLEISGYKVLRGSSFIGAEEIGFSNTTFTNIFEMEAGEKTYWILPIDIAQNEGNPVSTTVDVDEPPNFNLLSSYITPFESAADHVVNTVDCTAITIPSVQENPILLFSPEYASYSWDDAISVEGTYTTIQNRISAGYQQQLTPAVLSVAVYTETVDYLVQIEGATINLSVQHELLKGTGNYTLSTQISTSDDNVNWVDHGLNKNSVFTSFRYVKYRVYCTLENDKQLVAVKRLSFRLSLKQKTSSGVVENINNFANKTDLALPITGHGFFSEKNTYGRMISSGLLNPFYRLTGNYFVIEMICSVTKEVDPGDTVYWYPVEGKNHYGFGFQSISSQDKTNHFLCMFIRTGSGTYATISSTAKVPIGEMTHCAVKYDDASNSVKFYVNGVLKDTVTTSASYVDNWDEEDFFLGYNLDFFLSELRIWDGTVSDADILAYYDKIYTVGFLPANLMTYFIFAEPFWDDANERYNEFHFTGAYIEMETSDDYHWRGCWVPLQGFLDVQSVITQREGIENPEAIIITDFKDIPAPKGFAAYALIPDGAGGYEILAEDISFSYQVTGV